MSECEKSKIARFTTNRLFMQQSATSDSFCRGVYVVEFFVVEFGVVSLCFQCTQNGHIASTLVRRTQVDFYFSAK